MVVPIIYGILSLAIVVWLNICQSLQLPNLRSGIWIRRWWKDHLRAFEHKRVVNSEISSARKNALISNHLMKQETQSAAVCGLVPQGV